MDAAGASGLLANVLDGGDDVGVGAATADVAAHQFLDVGVARAAWLLEQGDRGHDLAGSAVAALVAVMLDERGLHGVEIAGVPEALDRGDGVALVHDREREAGVDAAAIHMNGAGSALAVVAALFGSRE